MELASLFTVAAAYGAAHDLPLSAVSKRCLNDSARLPALKAGGCDIGARRLRRTMLWFAENWPTGIAWPAGISRPIRTAEDDAADRARAERLAQRAPRKAA